MSLLGLLDDIGRTGLEIKRLISWDEAVEFTRKIDDLESGIQFGIGDWLDYCERTFGEEYTQLIPEGKEATWLVYKWVASRVNYRSSNLTWSHHLAVAGLLSERQQAYLTLAEKENLSVSKLRQMVREGKGKDRTATMITCPLCGGSFERGKNSAKTTTP